MHVAFTGSCELRHERSSSWKISACVPHFWWKYRGWPPAHVAIVEDVRVFVGIQSLKACEPRGVASRVDGLAVEVVVDLVVVDLRVRAGRAHEVAQVRERAVLLVRGAVLVDGRDRPGREARVGVDRVAEEREEVGLVAAGAFEHLEVVERGRPADGEAVGVGRDDEAEDSRPGRQRAR